jgi:hypothetical protein
VCWICDRPGATERDYDRIRGLQLVHADKRGRWPWDRQYQGVRGGQPVLGTREPAERRRRVG